MREDTWDSFPCPWGTSDPNLPLSIATQVCLHYPTNKCENDAAAFGIMEMFSLFPFGKPRSENKNRDEKDTGE